MSLINHFCMYLQGTFRIMTVVNSETSFSSFCFAKRTNRPVASGGSREEPTESQELSKSSLSEGKCVDASENGDLRLGDVIDLRKRRQLVGSPTCISRKVFFSII